MLTPTTITTDVNNSRRRSIACGWASTVGISGFANVVCILWLKFEKKKNSMTINKQRKRKVFKLLLLCLFTQATKGKNSTTGNFLTFNHLILFFLGRTNKLHLSTQWQLPTIVVNLSILASTNVNLFLTKPSPNSHFQTRDSKNFTSTEPRSLIEAFRKLPGVGNFFEKLGVTAQVLGMKECVFL